jgi:hypothetical protein
MIKELEKQKEEFNNLVKIGIFLVEGLGMRELFSTTLKKNFIYLRNVQIDDLIFFLLFVEVGCFLQNIQNPRQIRTFTKKD